MIRDEALYFWGYFFEADLEKLKSDALSRSNTDDSMLAFRPFQKELFKNQPTLEEIRKQYGGKIYLHSSESTKSPQSTFIEAVLDTTNQRITLTDMVVLPFLPISQEIDKYLDETTRVKMLDMAHKSGKPTLKVLLEVFIDAPILKFVALEPKVKLVALRWHSQLDILATQHSSQNPAPFYTIAHSNPQFNAKASESRQLCIGKDLLYKEFWRFTRVI